MAERYLSVSTFASHLDVSTRTVKRWIDKKIISTRRFKTGDVRIPASQMDHVFVPERKNTLSTPPQFDINRLVAEVQSRGNQITNRQEV